MAPIALAYGGEKKWKKNLDRSRSDLRESNMNVCHTTSVIVEFCYGHLF